MNSLKVNKISINEFTPSKTVRRIGLDTRLSGVPAFLLYLREPLEESIFHLNSHEDVRVLIERTENEDDRKTWKMILSFFETGGSLALVAISKLESDGQNNILSEMIGIDGGLESSSGIFKLRRITELADLVVVPQAPQLLNKENLIVFYNKLIGFSEKIASFFIFMDTPIKSSIEESAEISNRIFSSDAALFFPWMVCDDVVVPSSIIVSGIYQNNDRVYSVSDNPSNRPQKIPWKPIYILGPNELSYLNENKINCIQILSDDDVRIWGAYTLSVSSDSNDRFISVRRAMKSIKRTLDHVCSPYVLAPLVRDISNEIEITIEDLFNKNKEIFDPMIKNPFKVYVAINTESAIGYIDVDVRVKLPNCLDELKLAIEYEN